MDCWQPRAFLTLASRSSLGLNSSSTTMNLVWLLVMYLHGQRGCLGKAVRGQEQLLPISQTTPAFHVFSLKQTHAAAPAFTACCVP